MNGCIYRTKDGECDLYAEGGKYTAFCEMENCVGRKMANTDRVRSMTDEELAEIVVSVCPPNYPHGNCREYEKFDGNLDCCKCWLDWLKSPVEVQMSETVAKRRDNLRLMWIAENNWLKREPPIWKFWAWRRWKRERPVWEEVSE